MKYTPGFIPQFFTKIFFQLKRFVGEVQVLALEIIRDRLDDINEAFLSIQPLLNDLLHHRDHEAQRIALEIVYKLLPGLDAKQVGEFIYNLINTFPTHPNQKCRELYYNILIWLYDHHDSLKGIARQGYNSINSVESSEFRHHLLKGITDRSPDISSVLKNFWNSPEHLPDEPLGRTKALMGALYFPDLEENWLKYSTQLVLDLATKSPDYNKPLFESLENCVYQVLI